MDKLLRVPDVVAATGLSRVTLWRKVKEGKFPPPVEISENRIGWMESDIRRWIEARPRRVYGLVKNVTRPIFRK